MCVCVYINRDKNYFGKSEKPLLKLIFNESVIVVDNFFSNMSPIQRVDILYSNAPTLCSKVRHNRIHRLVQMKIMNWMFSEMCLEMPVHVSRLFVFNHISTVCNADENGNKSNGSEIKIICWSLMYHVVISNHQSARAILERFLRRAGIRRVRIYCFV